MKKLTIFALSFFLGLQISLAQHEAEMMQIKVGYGFSFFNVEQTTKITIGNSSIETTNTYKNRSKIIPFSLQMGVLDRVSLGVYGRIGNYFLDTTDSDTRNDKIMSFGLITELYPINEEKFNIFLNAGGHFTFLTIYNTMPFLTNEYKYVGFGPIANAGANFYPLSFLGISLWGGYEGHFLSLNEWFVNGNPQNMNNIEQKRKTTGFHIGAGLNISF